MVGGPIQYAFSSETAGFDSALKATLESLIVVLDQAGYEVLSAHRTEDYGDGVVPGAEVVVRRDYDFVSSCDVYVACLPFYENQPLRSDGTHVEIGWAVALGKPCVILCSANNLEAYSFLVQGLSAVARVDFYDLEQTVSSPESLVEAVTLATKSSVGVAG